MTIRKTPHAKDFVGGHRAMQYMSRTHEMVFNFEFYHKFIAG